MLPSTSFRAGVQAATNTRKVATHHHDARSARRAHHGLETPAGGRIPSHWRALLLSVLGILVIAVAVFLGASDFFSSWDGQVASSAPPRGDDPQVLTVRIVGADRSVVQRAWPAELVRSLELPVDRVDIPPPTIPPERPTTRKARFDLSFSLTTSPGTSEEHTVRLPTTSPRGLGLAGLVFLGLLAVRNMVYAGSPIAIQARGAYLPPAQSAPGVPATGSGRNGRKGRNGRSRGGAGKGPPPGKRRRGRGRR